MKHLFNTHLTVYAKTYPASGRTRTTSGFVGAEVGLETAKFNVLTAHSTREALDLFHLFPNVSMAVLVGEAAIDCDAVAKHIRTTTDKVPIVFVTGRIGGKCDYAHHSQPRKRCLNSCVRCLVIRRR